MEQVLIKENFSVIADPEAVEVVIKTCLEKDEMTFVTRPLLGNGSIFAPVSIWRPRRKVLATTFGQKTLNGFVKIFSKQAAILTEQLKPDTEKDSFSILDRVTKYSMDSVCETTLGVEVNSQSVTDHPIPKSFTKLCDLVSSRMLKPWLYSDYIYKWHWDFPEVIESTNVVKKFVAEIIQSKRLKMKEQNKNVMGQSKHDCEKEISKPKSFLEMLIESGGNEGFSDLELQEETIVMLFAGTDTSSIAISFTVMLLAQRPHIQDKIYQEIQEVISDTKRPIEVNDLPKLKYLEAVVKESLRLYPPAPVIIRKVVGKGVTLPSGVTLVPGVGVTIHIWAIQRNPKYWGNDATVFRPERFLEGSLKHPYAFLPFSTGSRNCLGYQYAMMSVKTVMAQIIRRYRILPATTEGSIDEEIPVKYEVMMKHAGNFEVKLMFWQILSLVLVLLLLLRWKNRKFRNVAERLPNNMKQVPILGHVLYFMGNNKDRMDAIKEVGREALNQSGKTSAWLVHKLHVVIADPEIVESISKTCLEKNEVFNIFKILIGNGSIFAPVQIWRHRRKAISPILAHKTITSFVKIFSNQSAVMMDLLKGAVGKGTFSIFNTVCKYSMDTLCDTASTKVKSMLEISIESDELNDLELQEEFMVLVVAGIQTSAITIGFVSLVLAKYPNIQEKVYQEIQEVLGSSDRHIDPTDLPKLKYLEAVIKETLRLYPPAPLIVRQVSDDVTLPTGLKLVPGVGIVIHIWAIHRNPKYWGPDADVFRPERFLEGPLKHPCAFMPFSNGPRGCVGSQFAMMSVKTNLTHLVRRYRILPADNCNQDEELPVTFDIFVKHADNFEIKLEFRNK
ncbi:uncharacterized protein LOC106139766 [Amyelois transitella]|uniref:uncharacterized protein LOC106139766 n=1 Tax=Amyelois transitella TaxID=680683 RepID=UPI0029907860|nr:uncharacterized protein LOC106139766 [Amyelois transitella]